MTTELDGIAVSAESLAPDVVGQIASSAMSLDQGERDTRANVELLARSGVLGLGAPHNHNRALPTMAAVIAELAGHCMSTAFSVWAHRMTIEYLTEAATPWARGASANLTGGDALGVTGMASAFKDAAGCGTLDLAATPAGQGYRLTGTLRWASNLYSDSVMVTAAQTGTGEKLVVALPLATSGVTIGNHFDLLALGSTASSFLKLDDVYVGEDQILSRDIDAFLTEVRPTFLVLQSAMCVGLGRRCLDEVEPSLNGVNSAFAVEFDSLSAELVGIEAQVTSFAAAGGGPPTPAKRERLTLRLTPANVGRAG